MAKFDKERIIEQLESLKNLPKIKEVKALIQRLEKELEKFTESQVIPKTPEKEITFPVNVKRSNKLERYWRYVKLIRDNFPNLKTNQIRSQLKKRKMGHDSDIPDAVWQNPSG